MACKIFLLLCFFLNQALTKPNIPCPDCCVVKKPFPFGIQITDAKGERVYPNNNLCDDCKYTIKCKPPYRLKKSEEIRENDNIHCQFIAPTDESIVGANDKADGHEISLDTYSCTTDEHTENEKRNNYESLKPDNNCKHEKQGKYRNQGGCQNVCLISDLKTKLGEKSYADLKESLADVTFGDTDICFPRSPFLFKSRPEKRFDCNTLGQWVFYTQKNQKIQPETRLQNPSGKCLLGRLYDRFELFPNPASPSPADAASPLVVGAEAASPLVVGAEAASPLVLESGEEIKLRCIGKTAVEMGVSCDAQERLNYDIETYRKCPLKEEAAFLCHIKDVPLELTIESIRKLEYNAGEMVPLPYRDWTEGADTLVCTKNAKWAFLEPKSVAEGTPVRS